MEAKTRNRRRTSYTSASFANTREIGKYLCFLVTRATKKQQVDLEDLVLYLTRLRDLLAERAVKERSVTVYDSNRGQLHPRELYRLIHIIYSDTNIEVYQHKKYRLNIG